MRGSKVGGILGAASRVGSDADAYTQGDVSHVLEVSKGEVMTSKATFKLKLEPFSNNPDFNYLLLNGKPICVITPDDIKHLVEWKGIAVPREGLAEVKAAAKEAYAENHKRREDSSVAIG